ncbi:Uncharacterised protein [uncultured Comamonas sp.]|nr:Uncharacterised protein [uncultured Comamonas sp.]
MPFVAYCLPSQRVANPQVTDMNLSEELLAQLQGAPLQQMAQQLGAGTDQVQSALGQALPVLFGALGQNAAQPQGAADLLGALLKDHGGSGAQGLGGLLGGLLGAGGSGNDGAAILGHMLGGARSQVEGQLGQASGLGDKIGPLLAMVAPLVMQFLSQRAQGGNLDAGSLGQLLGQEKASVQQQGGLAGGLLGSLLDQNGDGKLDATDLFKLGASFLGKR